jgi:hypothetical protein
MAFSKLITRLNKPTPEDVIDQINRCAAGYLPSQDSSDFPYQALRQLAEKYIARSKSLSPIQLEQHILGLIRDHGGYEMTLAAFIPCLSTAPIKMMLNDDVARWTRGQITLKALTETLCVTNHWRPDLVGNAEMLHAKGLLDLQNELKGIGSEIGWNRWNIDACGAGPFVVLRYFAGTQVPEGLIVSSTFRKMAESQFEWLAGELETCAALMDWHKAYLLSSWLPDFKSYLWDQPSRDTEFISMREILDEKFTSWHYWAAWTPDFQKIKAMKQWSAEDQTAFMEITKLEGPSFSDATMASQRDAMIDTATEEGMLPLGAIVLSLSSGEKAHVRKMLALLIDVVSRTAASFGDIHTQRMRLVRQATYGRLVTERILMTLSECTTKALTIDLLDATNRILFKNTPGSDMPRDALLSLLTILDRLEFPNLGAMVGPKVLNALSEHLHDWQEVILDPEEPPSKWTDSDLQNLDKLQKFGIVLRYSRFSDLSNISPFTSLVRQWPERAEFDKWVAILRDVQAKNESPYAISVMQKYLKHRFSGSVLAADDRQAVEYLISQWHPDTPRRRLLLIILELSISKGSTVNFKIDCLSTFSKLGEDLVVSLVSLFIDDCFGDAVSLHLLINALAKHEEDIIKLWQFAPLWHIELRPGNDILNWALESLSLESWFDFVDNLYKVFPAIMGGKAKQHTSIILRHSLVSWSNRLGMHRGLLSILESHGSRVHHAIKTILRGSEDENKLLLFEQTLRILSHNISSTKESLLLDIFAFLDWETDNIMHVFPALSYAADVSDEGLWTCETLVQSYNTLSMDIVDTLLVYLVNDSTIRRDDKEAFMAIAELINLENERSYDVHSKTPDESNVATTDMYLREEMQSLAQEAARLEGIRRELNRIDRNEMIIVMKELGIEDAGVLRTAVEGLPADLINCVSLINENVFEMQFSLDKLKPLTRRAVGAGEATSLIVRITAQPGEMPVKFCVHFNTDIKPRGVKGHTQTSLTADSTKGQIVACYSRMTPLMHQISMRMAKYIKQNMGISSIKALFDYVSSELENLGTGCTVCGANYQSYPTHDPSIATSSVAAAAMATSRNDTRRILALCNSASCDQEYTSYPLGVRLAALYEDPAVLDMLIQGISASVHANTFESLTLTLPTGIDLPTVKKLLPKLPAISSLENEYTVANVDTANGLAPGTTASFLAWVCSKSYSGFITRATDSLRLPSFPGSHQFLFAESDPSREAEFRQKIIPGSGTQIMWHGTTMSRLPLILSQGLKNMSGTALQAHGSSFGKGIYLSPEPGTAWPYSAALPISHSWGASQFKGGYGVMLGVEVAGKWTPVSSNKNIFVVTDEKAVMVRMVILLLKKDRVPIANHVTPSLTSICANLRSGAI